MNKLLGVPTIKYIVRSGMLAMAHKLRKRDGKLGNEQYREIQEKYNFNNFNELRNIITLDLVKKIYDE